MYGVDVEDAALMRSRTWRWLQTRMEGLVSLPPVAQARVPVDETHERVAPLWRTRIQTHLYGEEA